MRSSVERRPLSAAARAPVFGTAPGQLVNTATEMGQIRKALPERNIGQRARGAHYLTPSRARAALQSEPFRRYAKFPAENIRYRVRPKAATLGPFLQLDACAAAKRARQIVDPVSIAWCNSAAQARLQLCRCGMGVDFDQPRERIRVGNVKLSFHRVMPPWQAKDLEGSLIGLVQVAVESSMKEDLSRFGMHPPCEADLSQAPREHYGRIPLVVMMSWHAYGARERLDPGFHATEFIARLGACPAGATEPPQASLRKPGKLPRPSMAA